MVEFCLLLTMLAAVNSGPGQTADPICRFDTTEFLLDTTPSGYAPGGSVAPTRTPAVAFDGQNYLVVWSMTRSNRQAIWGARISWQGGVLDTAPFLVCSTQTAAVSHCEVAWGETCFFVVAERRGDDIVGARVTRNGRSLDPLGIVIAADADRHLWPTVTYDGRKFVVAWYRRGTVSTCWHEIRSTSVSTGGIVDTVGGRPVIRLSSWRRRQMCPSVVSDGTMSLITWQSDEAGPWSIHAARIDSTGAVLDSTPILISDEVSSGTAPIVVRGDSNFLVVWNRSLPLLADLVAKRVAAGGQVLDRNPIPVGRTVTGTVPPGVAFNGSNYVIGWQGSPTGLDDVSAARLSPAGVPLDTPGRPIVHGDQHELTPVLAAGAGNCLLAWIDCANQDNPTVYAARIRADLTLLDTPFAVSPYRPVLIPTYSEQIKPDVAFDGTNYLVVWEDARSGAGNQCIYGIRIDTTGTILDNSVRLVYYDQDWRGSPALAAGDSGWLAVWEDHRGNTCDIVGARISPGGTVLDPQGLAMTALPGEQTQPDAAFDGVNYLVVWRDGSIRGGRLDQRGARLDSVGFTISTSDAAKPTVVACDSSYLTAFEAASRIARMRVASTGGRLDSTNLTISHLIATEPNLATTGRLSLAVWRGQNGGHISAGRVGPDGRPVDSADIVLRPIGTGTASQPDVAFDGRRFVAAWEDRRDGGRWDLCGARVDTNGEFIDSFALVRHNGVVERGSARSPALAHGPGRQVLLVYACSTGTVNGNYCGRNRIRARFYQDLTLDAPTLLWPPDTHNFLEPPVTLQAQTVAGADSYCFRVRTPSGTVIWQQSSALTGCTVPDSVLANRSFLAGCRVRDARGWSGSSQSHRFSTAFTPIPLAPPDSQVFRDAPVLLQVDSSPTADRYEFHVRRIHDSLVWSGVVDGPTCAVPCSLLADGLHTWRARAHRWSGWSALSESSRFCIRFAPDPIWPPANHVFRDAPVDLSVDSNTVGDRFDFRVWPVHGGDTWQGIVATPICTVPPPAVPDTSYAWQCRVRKPFGWTGFSLGAQFRTHFAPDPIWPPGGLTFLDTPITFRVDSAATGDSFDFRVWRAGSGSSWHLLTTTTVCTLREHLYMGAQYYWQCRRLQSWGWSSYGSSRQFGANLTPCLLAPADSVPVRAPPVVLLADTSDGGVAYQFRVWRFTTAGDTWRPLGPGFRVEVSEAWLRNAIHAAQCRRLLPGSWSHWSPAKVFPVAFAPQPVWPPDRHWYWYAPVVLVVDTLARADSFDFRIVPGGAPDTLHRMTTTPRCTLTVGDLNDSLYVWRCRLFGDYGWTDFSPALTFRVSLLMDSIPRLRLRRALVSLRSGENPVFELRGVRLGRGLSLDITDAAGRRAAVFHDLHNGPLVWDLSAGGSRARSSGVYFVRLYSPDLAITRKLVIFP